MSCFDVSSFVDFNKTQERSKQTTFSDRAQKRRLRGMHCRNPSKKCREISDKYDSYLEYKTFLGPNKFTQRQKRFNNLKHKKIL